MRSTAPDSLPLLAEPLRNEDDIDRITYAVRELALRFGFSPLDANLLSAATSEVATNAVVHGGGGHITVEPIGNNLGLEVVVADDGPGIADLEQAFVEGFSTRPGGLGIGLAAARRAADHIDVDSGLGQGTTVTTRYYLSPTSDWFDVGLAASPDAAYEQNGDLAYHRYYAADEHLIAVVDAMGQGPQAEAVSNVVREVLDQARRPHPQDLLMAAHDAVLAVGDGERGFVAIAFTVGRSRIELAGIGDVSIRAIGPDLSEPFGFGIRPGRLGAIKPGQITEASFDVAQHRPLAIVVSTDGIRSNFPATELSWNATAQQLAFHLLATQRHPHGDAAVAVVKLS